MQKKIHKKIFVTNVTNSPKVVLDFLLPQVLFSVLCRFSKRKELFQIIFHEIASIVEAKDYAIENKHHSVPFEDCIGNFDIIFFKICFYILNLIESSQLEYDQAIVQHGHSHE